MNALTDGVQILRDAGGHPAFAVLPFAQYQALVSGSRKAEATVPHAVVSAVVDGQTTIAAWREHLRLTQAEVAARMGVSQAAYAQMESVKHPRKATLEKISAALGLEIKQLTW